MKKLYAYGVGLGVLVFAVLYLPSDKGVVNDPKNEICFSDELVSIAIPESLVTLDYVGETYSIYQEVSFAGVDGFVYGEIDENENFYYLGHSSSLNRIFDFASNDLLFSQFENKQNVLHATYSDCMGNCDETLREGGTADGDKMPGYGRCRFRCWVDVLF